MGARRGNGVPFETIGAEELGPGRELGVDSAATENIDG